MQCERQGWERRGEEDIAGIPHWSQSFRFIPFWIRTHLPFPHTPEMLKSLGHFLRTMLFLLVPVGVAVSS